MIAAPPPPPRAVAVVAVIAGRHVPVTCDDDLHREWGGYVYILDRIRLRPDVCDGIRRFLAGVDDPVSDASVLLLAHEAWHASRRPGWQDETLTECRAYRSVDAVGWLLGADEVRANRLQAEVAWYHDWLREDPTYGRTTC